MIAHYDAGWLVDPSNAGEVEAVLDEILGDPGVVRQTTKNARALASAVVNPTEAVKPLLRIMESL
jgi:hypothetical protein